jgi:hypothetical protein
MLELVDNREELKKRMRYTRRPTPYDENLLEVDEQICALLKRRKEISNQDSSNPPEETIAQWASTYELYEEYLQAVFGTLGMEKHYKPRVVPAEFRRHIPILKSIELDEKIYTITFIRQYANASVLHLYIDWDGVKDSAGERDRRSSFELYISDQYECRWEGGGGRKGHDSWTYVISPPLPDEIQDMAFVFKEVNPIKMELSGFSFVIWV